MYLLPISTYDKRIESILRVKIYIFIIYLQYELYEEEKKCFSLEVKGKDEV